MRAGYSDLLGRGGMPAHLTFLKYQSFSNIYDMVVLMNAIYA